MNRTILILVAAATTIASSAFAQVNVNVDIRVPPPPRVIVSSPPAIRFDTAPLFIAPSRLGFYVGVDTPYDILFSSDYYYLYYGNGWHRSGDHNGPWIEVPYHELPPNIRRYRIEQIRTYRDREYRLYRNDRDHYRGRSFHPDHERRQELKKERRRDKDEWQEERHRDKEEWKEEKQDRKRHGRDRD